MCVVEQSGNRLLSSVRGFGLSGFLSERAISHGLMIIDARADNLIIDNSLVMHVERKTRTAHVQINRRGADLKRYIAWLTRFGWTD